MPTLRLLGAVRIESGDRTAPLRLPGKAIELLGYLCAHGVPTSREVLATLLWPDVDPEDARPNLRRQLHNVSRALPAHDVPNVLATNAALQWNPLAPLVVDVVAFRAALGAGDDPCVWYGGDFLEGRFEDWILVEREKLRGDCVAALADRVRRKRGERDLRGALEDVARLLEIDPWREDVVRIELTLRNQLGDRGGALAAYRAFAIRLQRELDTEPMPETRALYDRLASGDDVASEPSAAHADRSPRAQSDERRGLPLRGRDAELTTLTAAWSAAARGRAAMVSIGGEAGVGKSRLAQELALRAEAEGAHVFLGTTSPGERGPHEALVEILRGAMPLLERTLRDPQALANLLPLLPELEARHGIAEQASIEDRSARVRLFDAAATTFAALAAARPLVLLFEDMHWAGAASFDLLQFLVRRAGHSPILFAATYREEETRATHPFRAMRKRLEAEGLSRNVALERLDATAADSIVRAVLGAAVSDRVVADILAKSDGLPLFLNEAINQPAGTLDAEALGVTKRLAALPDDARTLVEIAAIVGNGFDTDLLIEASGWPEAAVVRALAPLVAARLVREPYRRTRNDYVFSHHLIAAAIYANIGASERTRRHGIIGHALAGLGAENEAERAGEIAHHFARGGPAREASAWYARAAEHAASLWATEDALEFARLAIEHGEDRSQIVRMRLLRSEIASVTLLSDVLKHELDRLDEIALEPEDAVRCAIYRSMDLRQEDRYTEARATLDRALALADANDVPVLLRCALYDEFAHVARSLNDFDRIEFYANAIESIGAGTRYATIATFHLGIVAMRRANFDRLYEINARAIEPARETGDLVSEGHAWYYVAIAQQSRGRFDEAETAYARAQELLARCDYQRVLHNLMLNRASLLGSRGDYAAMLPVHAEIEERTRAYFGAEHSLINLLNWAMCEACLDNGARARALLEPFEPAASDPASDQTAVWWFVTGLAAWTQADVARARAHLLRSTEVYRALGVSGSFAMTLAFAALATRDAGDLEAAHALAREAADVDAELRAQCDFPHVILWSLAATTSGARARATFDRAMRLYTERTSTLGNPERAAAYAAAPWNARFLRECAVAVPSLVV